MNIEKVNDHMIDSLNKWVQGKYENLHAEKFTKLFVENGAEMAADLRSAPIIDTGIYRRAWTNELTDRRKDYILVTVKDPGAHGPLSWILEYGHLTKNHTEWIPARPHIMKDFRKTQQRLKRGIIHQMEKGK